MLEHEGKRGDCNDLREHVLVQKEKDKFQKRGQQAVAQSAA